MHLAFFGRRYSMPLAALTAEYDNREISNARAEQREADTDLSSLNLDQNGRNTFHPVWPRGTKTTVFGNLGAVRHGRARWANRYGISAGHGCILAAPARRS